MQQLVQAGLDQTQKEASIKRGIDEGLQAVQAVRGIVDKAVQLFHKLPLLGSVSALGVRCECLLSQLQRPVDCPY